MKLCITHQPTTTEIWGCLVSILGTLLHLVGPSEVSKGTFFFPNEFLKISFFLRLVKVQDLLVFKALWDLNIN